MKTLINNSAFKGCLGVAVIAASMLAAPSAMAEEHQKEISIAASIDSSSNSGGGTSYSSTMTFINAAAGYYFKPKLVGMMNISLFSTDYAGTTSTSFGLGVGAKYYFGEAAKSKWVPFVLGYVDVDTMDAGGTSFSGGGITAGGGVSNFITEQVSMDITLEGYARSLSGGGISLTSSGGRLLFGMTARF